MMSQRQRSIPIKATRLTMIANQSTVAPPGKSACIPNQTARFKTTPTTAAVIAESAALRLHVAAQPLDVGRAEKNPEEAGDECRPRGDECAGGRGDDRRRGRRDDSSRP